MTDTPAAESSVEFVNGDRVVISAADQTLRTDVWVQCFDGVYRFFLGQAQIAELERKCGFTDREGNKQVRGIFAIFGRVAKGRYELKGEPVGLPSEGEATIDDCRETVRLALIGGGHAIVNGERVQIGAQRASQLVATYLAPAPMEQSWNLAYLALYTLIHGRKQSAAEAGTASTTAVYPDEPSDAAD